MTLLQAFGTPAIIGAILWCLVEICGSREAPNIARGKR